MLALYKDAFPSSFAHSHHIEAILERSRCHRSWQAGRLYNAQAFPPWVWLSVPAFIVSGTWRPPLEGLVIDLRQRLGTYVPNFRPQALFFFAKVECRCFMTLCQLLVSASIMK